MMKVKALFIGAAMAVALTVPATAKHSWKVNGVQLHWARTANPVSPLIAYDLDPFRSWGNYIGPMTAVWNDSAYPDPDVVEFQGPEPGDFASFADCPPATGVVRVCDYAYGSNGWLGVAQVWFEDLTGHIEAGVVKLNDTYFDTSTYNTPNWRMSVMCQEIGHTLGLGHQNARMFDKDLKDKYGRETCMDYTAKPAGNTQPNLHDFEQLASIYSHVDTYTGWSTSATSKNADEVTNADPSDWGRAIALDASGRGIVYLKSVGKGLSRVTFVRRIPPKSEPQ